MRPVAIVLGVLAVALLAGCSGDGGGDEAPAGDGGPAPVVAAIEAKAGNRTARAGGTLPVQVGEAVAFDASGSTGAVVSYAWSFGDNGTSDRRLVEHAFGAPGRFDVTLTVTGLGNVSADASLRVEVAPSLSGTLLYTDAMSFEGELPLMNPNACTAQGVDCRDHAVTVAEADPAGLPAVAKAARIALAGSGEAAVDMQLFWRGPDGTTLASTPAGGLEHAIAYAEPMPPGDYVVRVRLFVGAQASYTVGVEVDYVHP